MCRGRPDRASSSNPAKPRAEYRARQAVTVGRDTPTRTAIAVFATPSEASSTIRARCARPARTELDRVRRTNSSRSPARNGNAEAGRFGTPHHPNHPTANQLTTRGTSDVRQWRHAKPRPLIGQKSSRRFVEAKVVGRQRWSPVAHQDHYLDGILRVISWRGERQQLH